MATLYDKSLDQFASHYLSFSNLMVSPLPFTTWRDYWPGGFSGSGTAPIHTKWIPELEFTHFDEGLFLFYSPRRFDYALGGAGGVRLTRMRSRNTADIDFMVESAPMAMAMEEASVGDMEMKMEAPAPAPPKSQLSDTAKKERKSAETETSAEPEMGQVRENLEETAFFMPAIVTDNQGILALKFRLPESVTTWRFLGLATDREANSGYISGESVAQKEVMVVPNVPRFVRVGDKAQISARVINTSDHEVKGKARMLLIDPEDESVCYEQEVKVSIPANQTQAVTFQFQPEAGKALLVCRVMATGEGFSDGEQHYLPVLPDREQVTVTLPITQHGPQTTRIDLAQLFPKGTTDGKLTIEYTNNPAWLMVQALPSLAEITSENAISLAANYYANAIGQYIMNLSPNIEQTIGKWKAETSQVGSLTSHLAKNEELKQNVMKFCQARLCPPLLGQLVAEATIDGTTEEYMLNAYNQFEERRKFLVDGLNKIPGVYSPIPMGAFYTVARLPIDNSENFCRWLLEEFEDDGQTVMLAPASGFYTDPEMGKDEVRIAYAISKEDLAKALKVLQHALAVYPGRTVDVRNI